MIKNPKAKGSQREHKSIKLLEAVGYSCTRAAASLGVFDIIAVNSLGTRHIQVKSNKYPDPAERETMREMIPRLPINATVECWRWDDGARVPKIKLIQEFSGGAEK